MSRDFIFRSIKRNSLDYLGYVLNVSSKKELFQAMLELGFNPEAFEYHALETNSKAIAICLPFRGSKDNDVFNSETETPKFISAPINMSPLTPPIIFMK